MGTYKQGCRLAPGQDINLWYREVVNVRFMFRPDGFIGSELKLTISDTRCRAGFI